MRPEDQEEFEADSFTGSQVVFEGRVINLRLNSYLFDEKPKIFEIVEHPGAAVIVPIDESGKIILVRQWRRAAEEILIELPAGMLEKEEEPIVCAQRELQEETGFGAHKFTSLGGFYSAPGFCNEFLHLFLAEDLYSAPLPPDENESIDLLLLSLEEILELIRQNQILDAKTVAGILRYQLFLNS